MSTENASGSSAQVSPAQSAAPAASNLPLGAVAGFAAAIVGAAIWAAITAATEYQIGWMAIGVGFLVGFAVRLVGRGTEPAFGIAGAVLALLGCALGNLLTITWFLAQQEGAPFFSVLTSLDIALVIDLMKATFAPMDLLFYAIAAYCGFRYAIVPAGNPS
jgi:hypothetical protein